MRPLIYHVTPITPERVLRALAGRYFLISYARPDQAALVERIAAGIVYDNSAFQAFTLGRTPDWPAFEAWVEPRLDRPGRWAVIPDVIDGGEDEQERLIELWGLGHRGAPVWHSAESIERLLRLIAAGWPRICIGSSGAHWQIGSPSWLHRMGEVREALAGLDALPDIHLLRGASQAARFEFLASADASTLGQNHHRYAKPLFAGTPDEHRGVAAYADKLEGRSS
jgi:hypothetical protein